MNKKHKGVLAIVLIALIGIAGLWNVDLAQGYLLVSELVEHPDKYVGKNVNTMGTVKDGTLNMSTSGISFILEDPEDTAYGVKVVYVGDLPANLADGSQISLTGKMLADRIEAERIVMGCPSKYSE